MLADISLYTSNFLPDGGHPKHVLIALCTVTAWAIVSWTLYKFYSDIIGEIFAFVGGIFLLFPFSCIWIDADTTDKAEAATAMSEAVREQFANETGIALDTVCNSTNIMFNQTELVSGYDYARIDDMPLCSTDNYDDAQLRVVANHVFGNKTSSPQHTQSLIDLNGAPTMVFVDNNTEKFDHFSVRAQLKPYETNETKE